MSDAPAPRERGGHPIGEITVDCRRCPLQKLDCFRPHNAAELDFVLKLKQGEVRVARGETAVVDGAVCDYLYTVLSGWAFRYRRLEDGRRQIMNYLVPGDVIGLQGSLTGEMQHSVEALSPLLLCAFPRHRLMEMYRNCPELSYDLTWIAAREEMMLEEHLLSIGRRSASERIAYLIAFIFQRGRKSGAVMEDAWVLPIRQQHIADTLGLSIVHANKTIKRITRLGLVRWLDRGGCEVLNEEGLLALAGWAGITTARRPFI